MVNETWQNLKRARPISVFFQLPPINSRQISTYAEGSTARGCVPPYGAGTATFIVLSQGMFRAKRHCNPFVMFFGSVTCGLVILMKACGHLCHECFIR